MIDCDCNTCTIAQLGTLVGDLMVLASEDDANAMRLVGVIVAQQEQIEALQWELASADYRVACLTLRMAGRHAKAAAS
jgi:hypothetical protein